MSPSFIKQFLEYLKPKYSTIVKNINVLKENLDKEKIEEALKEFFKGKIEVMTMNELAEYLNSK